MTLEYDGTCFAGSQVQPGRRTVQGVLDEAIQRIAPGSGSTTFAGRTDRGVHALGQVVSLDLLWKGSPERCRDALNSILPRDVAVRSVELASPTFHARFDARWREYRYRVLVSPTPPVLERRFVWWRKRSIDSVLADQAAARLVGTKPFGSVAGSGKSRTVPPEKLVRTVRLARWEATDSLGGIRHEFRVEATGFLPQMVRNMTAAVVEVGTGRRPLAWIDELLAANDRTVLGDAVPPEGLVLWRVCYDDDDEDDSRHGSVQHGEHGII